MSPQPEEDDTVHAQESEAQTDDAPTSEAAQKQAAKRRTKTGCLSEYTVSSRSTYNRLRAQTDIFLSMQEATNQMWGREAGTVF